MLELGFTEEVALINKLWHELEDTTVQEPWIGHFLY